MWGVQWYSMGWGVEGGGWNAHPTTYCITGAAYSDPDRNPNTATCATLKSPTRHPRANAADAVGSCRFSEVRAEKDEAEAEVCAEEEVGAGQAEIGARGGRAVGVRGEAGEATVAGRVAALVAPDAVARPCEVSSAHAMIIPEEITLVRSGLSHRAVSYRTISLRRKDSIAKDRSRPRLETHSFTSMIGSMPRSFSTSIKEGRGRRRMWIR